LEKGLTSLVWQIECLECIEVSIQDGTPIHHLRSIYSFKLGGGEFIGFNAQNV
jgi:hypothetical protein